MSKSTLLNIVAFITGFVAVFTTIAAILMIVNKALDDGSKGLMVALIVIGFVIAIGSRWAATRLSHY